MHELEKEVERLSRVVFGNGEDGLVRQITEISAKTEELNRRIAELEKMSYKIAKMEYEIDMIYKIIYRFLIPLVTVGIVADIIKLIL